MGKAGQGAVISLTRAFGRLQRCFASYTSSVWSADCLAVCPGPVSSFFQCSSCSSAGSVGINFGRLILYLSLLSTILFALVYTLLFHAPRIERMSDFWPRSHMDYSDRQYWHQLTVYNVGFECLTNNCFASLS